MFTDVHVLIVWPTVDSEAGNAGADGGFLGMIFPPFIWKYFGYESSIGEPQVYLINIEHIFQIISVWKCRFNKNADTLRWITCPSDSYRCDVSFLMMSMLTIPVLLVMPGVFL